MVELIVKVTRIIYLYPEHFNSNKVLFIPLLEILPIYCHL